MRNSTILKKLYAGFGIMIFFIVCSILYNNLVFRDGNILIGTNKLSLSFINTIAGGLFVLSGMIVSYMTIHSIVKSLIKFAGVMNDESEQTAGAAAQVSQTSQNISQGISKQAATLDQTSHNLEEISAMTKQTAENANQASILAGSTTEEVEKGDTAIKRMQESMSTINESSEKVQKIIKTIEEIAFQTNLLALNAAVEAARAGEHGKGFSVVADEVRNLAQRASSAAKDSAQLIEESSVRTKEGVQIVGLAREMLASIKESAKKTANLVNEIASAAREQSEGVSQITGSIIQMSRVEQQNAASTEEGAAAAEELASQSVSFKEMVKKLEEMSGGVKKVKIPPNTIIRRHNPEQIKHAGLERRKGGKGPRIINPEDIIPLEKDEAEDLKNF